LWGLRDMSVPRLANSSTMIQWQQPNSAYHRAQTG
jgi:hypothetical protein